MNVLATIDLSKLLGDSLRAGIGINGATFALAAVGLNVHFGFTGLVNFGMVAFMAAGAYGMAIIVSHGWIGGSIILGMATGITLAIVLALMVGVPALRLRAEYLAITTIAIGEALRLALRSGPLVDFAGGPFGLPTIVDRNAGVSLSHQVGRDWNPLFDGSDPSRTFGFWRLVFDAEDLWIVLIGWTLVVLTTLWVWRLVQSPWGQVITSIRDDEDAARAAGKDVFFYKLQSLALGGVIGAVAGIVATLDKGFVQADQFRPQTTFFTWTVLLLGGTASKWGPALGSVVFWFLLVLAEESVRQVVGTSVVPDVIIDSSNVTHVRLVTMGVMLIVLTVWRPQGLLGRKDDAFTDQLGGAIRSSTASSSATMPV